MEITEIEEYIIVDRGIVFQAGKRAWLRQLPIPLSENVYCAHWGKQNNAPPHPRDVHALIPRIFEYVTLHSKKNFAGIIKLKSLRWGDYQELSHGPNVIKNFLLNERGWQEN